MISRPIPITEQALIVAQTLHDAYEQRALDQFGYPPRDWDHLTPAEHRLRAEAVQEFINSERLLLMPNCSHPEAARRLVRRELVMCEACGLPVSMLRAVSREAT